MNTFSQSGSYESKQSLRYPAVSHSALFQMLTSLDITDQIISFELDPWNKLKARHDFLKIWAQCVSRSLF